jgi:hypothetical protein
MQPSYLLTQESILANDTLALATQDTERSMMRPLGIDPLHATSHGSISTDKVS